MSAQFGLSWFRAKHRISDPIDLDSAKLRHAERQPYVAALRDASDEARVIEFNGYYIGVFFYDKLRREYLSYVFVEKFPGKIFLDEAVSRQYLNDSLSPESTSVLRFNVSGRVNIIEERSGSDMLEKSEAIVGVDGNWDKYPDFMDYGSILRKERA